MTPDPADFPTAIVPIRAAPTSEKWDTLARRIADPMTTLFCLLQSTDPDLRFKAAAELMPYRHRKLRPADPEGGGGTGQQVNVQINIGSTDQVSQVTTVIPVVDPLD